MYRCHSCGKFQPLEDSDIAPKGGKYGWDVIWEVIKMRETGFTFSDIKTLMMTERGIRISMSTIHDWVHTYEEVTVPVAH